MNPIKITALSLLFLLPHSAFSSYYAEASKDRSALPERAKQEVASAQSDSDDEFGIPLIPKHRALKNLKKFKAELKDFIENSPYKQQLQKVQEAYCKMEKLSACAMNARQYVDDLKQQGASQAKIDPGNKQLEILVDLRAKENMKYDQHCCALKGDAHKLRHLLSSIELRQFIYKQSALLLRAQNEELLEVQQAMQTQIQQQAHEIKSLRAALQQEREPGEQHIEGVYQQSAKQ